MAQQNSSEVVLNIHLDKYSESIRTIVKSFVAEGWTFSHDYGNAPVLKNGTDMKIIHTSGRHFDYKG